MPRFELIGDSARGVEYAAVRLTVEDDRIVAASAPGLERSLVGLSLLEAAAVPGERVYQTAPGERGVSGAMTSIPTLGASSESSIAT